MAAAQYAARAGRTATMLESLAPGGQTMYIDMIENYPGFDQPISGFELGAKFQTQAEAFGAKLVYAGVTRIEKEGDWFTVLTSDGQTYRSKSVIFATGAKHRHLEVEGEEQYAGKGVSYCGTCDGPFFRGKEVVVVGGGDTALTEAIYLSKLTEHLTIIHRKQRFRAQENLIEQIRHNKNIQTVMEHVVKEIKGNGTKVTGVVLQNVTTGEVYERPCDAVFIFVGMIPQTDLLDKSVLDESGYVITNEKMETSIPGLYAVGDVRTTVFRQLVTAAADGAIAAHCASEYIDELEGRQYR